jgi:uncharacterized membrane protein
MKAETFFTLIRAYFAFGAVLMIVLVGRLIVIGFREVDVAKFSDAVFSGKKPDVAPATNQKIDRGGRLYRRVMLWWFIGFVLLIAASFVFRR